MQGFPNWRNKSEYPDKGSFQDASDLEDDALHTSKAWAWQFLRRHPQYQVDYDTRSNPGMNREIAVKYGLSFLLPYCLDNPHFIPFDNTLSLHSLDAALEKRISINLGESRTAIVFDFTRPIDPQLALAKMQLEEEIALRERRNKLPNRIEGGRKRPDVYSRYLRVLDADTSGAKMKDVAAHFISDGTYHLSDRSGTDPKVKADGDLKRAREILNMGYLNIAYTKNKE